MQIDALRRTIEIDTHMTYREIRASLGTTDPKTKQQSTVLIYQDEPKPIWHENEFSICEPIESDEQRSGCLSATFISIGNAENQGQPDLTDGFFK
ncbi:hypothetical protein EVAR_77337_1 [Eumeta japonica]|uniref:Mariner Mos1 transposase n=1 Tax=Eumeta variegata TaxID=151549 RepID=A0A4C1UYL1_EUMVA|nr:hypothetical protein EVAR_77337_1 [Eumeta japonica]